MGQLGTEKKIKRKRTKRKKEKGKLLTLVTKSPRETKERSLQSVDRRVLEMVGKTHVTYRIHPVSPGRSGSEVSYKRKGRGITGLNFAFANILAIFRGMMSSKRRFLRGTDSVQRERLNKRGDNGGRMSNHSRLRRHILRAESWAGQGRRRRKKQQQEVSELILEMVLSACRRET